MVLLQCHFFYRQMIICDENKHLQQGFRSPKYARYLWPKRMRFTFMKLTFAMVFICTHLATFGLKIHHKNVYETQPRLYGNPSNHLVYVSLCETNSCFTQVVPFPNQNAKYVVMCNFTMIACIIVLCEKYLKQ